MLIPLKPYFIKNRLGALLITNIHNVRLISGFTGTNGLVIATKKTNYFITDFRYREQAKRQIHGFRLVEANRELKTALTGILKRERVKRLGFEASDVSYAAFLKYKKMFRNITLVPLAHDPGLIRANKAAGEIARLKKALAINQRAFSATLPFIKPGVTEYAVARKLEQNLLKFGAEKIGFDTIVASGARGALPHGVASNKKLKKGELVTIDFGGVYQGYHADETVTMALGTINNKQRTIHRIVYEAQKAALKIAKPGVKCSALDKAARDYITKKGYGQYFGHALGHGVGLEVHERPVLSPKSKDRLKPGMVFTIEPGIYIPKWGGVRIEDVFVCTKRGVQKITKIPKKLRAA